MSWLDTPVLPRTPQTSTDSVILQDYVDGLPVLAQMAQTEQNPSFHAEGDVLVHTQMVCDQLTASQRWQELPADEQHILWLAAVLHDCGKPLTTVIEDGRWRSPRHAPVGAVVARNILWQAGVDALTREKVCALVGLHMTPYHLLDREDAILEAINISLTTNPSWLWALVNADARGRIAPDISNLIGNVDMAEEFMSELGIKEEPWPFTNDHSRFQYFLAAANGKTRDPSYTAYDDTRATLTLVSGLPGSGKDTWIREHGNEADVVSMDDIRKQLGVKHNDKRGQGHVKAQALEELRVSLRAGRNVIWNATNLSRSFRTPLIGLAHDYNFQTRIVCVETSRDELFRRANERNQSDDFVPFEAIQKMLHHWEFPQITEAHQIEVYSS